MEISNFKDMYLAELQELVSVEGQLADALLRDKRLQTRLPQIMIGVIRRGAG
jgi:hypothetical protein